jgi:hypothetical protein
MKHIECTANGTIGQAVETWSQAMKRGTRARQMAGRQMEYPDETPRQRPRDPGRAGVRAEAGDAEWCNRKIAACGRYRRRTRVVAGRGRSRGDGRGDAGGKCNGKKAVCGALEDGRGDAE